MEYQSIINLLDDTTNQPSKFRSKNWVKINDESRGNYASSSIKFKTSMTKSIYMIIVMHTYLLVEL